MGGDLGRWLAGGEAPPETEEPEQTPEPTGTDRAHARTDAGTGQPDDRQDRSGRSALAGACFQIGDAAEVCDNQEGDADGQDGVIRVEGLAPGELTVTETTAPEGFLAAEATSVTVESAGEAQLQIINEAVTGSFRVVKRDPDGSRIGGACFQLVGAETLGPWCDAGPDDVDDRTGVMEIQNIPVGEYTLTETEAPAGFVAAADQPMTITAGERTGVTIVNELANGSLAIIKTDVEGNAFVGACFTVGNALGVCDNGEDDADPTEDRSCSKTCPQEHIALASSRSTVLSRLTHRTWKSWPGRRRSFRCQRPQPGNRVDPEHR